MREGARIFVVNKAEKKKDKKRVKDAYRNAFPRIKNSQFQFRDAMEWVREFVAGDQQASSV